MAKILVQDQVIETTDIADIVDVEASKTHFLNREAGFVIIFMDNSTKVFKENIPYESYPHEISYTKDKWRRLMDSVLAQWKADSTEIKKFKL